MLPPGRLAASASSILMWHPASLLLVWILFALALQWAVLPVLLVLSALLIILVGAFARERTRRLLRRTRWLLASLAILFVFFSPGEYLPGVAGHFGITYEGLQMAVEHVARLVVMLASLSLLHERLGTAGLMAALYSFLAPVPWGRATVIRLMLVLESVEQKPGTSWREWLEEAPGEADRLESHTLQIEQLTWRDKAMMAAALLAMLWLVLGR